MKPSRKDYRKYNIKTVEGPDDYASMRSSIYRHRNCIISTNWQMKKVPIKRSPNCLVINVICHYRGNIVGGKRIMKLMGFDLGPNRTPFRNMTDEEEQAMKKELEAIHFFERCNQF